MITNTDRYFIERKYHDPEKEFDSFRRMAYHGIGYIDESGLDEQGLLEGLKNLENEINLLGSMPQEEVRMYMEKSEIFLFTSDFQEGWGAVLNEAMNSGCACVASHAIGSAPYLLQNEKNGIIFPNECNNILFEKVEDLMLNEKKRKKLALNAYDSMHNLWNAKIAVNRFLNLAETLLNGGNVILPESGPCSRPENLQNNWWYINEK